MLRASKWIECRSPDEPVTDTARRALKLRLEAVESYLPLAAYQAECDVEHVHQLRVATRRAMAALDIFKDNLPRRRRRRLMRKLRQIRRAAGDARDLDVLMARLNGRAKPCPQDALEAILGRLCRKRRRAQRPLRRVRRRMQRWELDRRVRQLTKRVRVRQAANPRRVQPFRTWAQHQLRSMVGEFFALGRPTTNLDDLHRFRIQAKRLRYAMEVFAGGMPPAMRSELYPAIESLQEKLGHINDRATAAARYERWLDKVTEPAQSACLREMLEEETRALNEDVKAFRKWWTDRRRMELERRFRRVLGQKQSRKTRGG